MTGWLITYLLLAAVGIFFFIYKTAVVPVFTAYAFVLPESRRRAYLAAWLPFLIGTVAFDIARGAIFTVVKASDRFVFRDYAIQWELAAFGTPALPLVFQQMHMPVLDTLAIAMHALHFVYFLLIGMVVWHYSQKDGEWLQQTLLLIMAVGLVCYFLVPTIPPWLAAEQGALPPIRHTVVGFYSRFVPQLHQAFDTNPLAAMPSLHTAFPVACAIVGSRTFGRGVGALLWLYVAALTLALIYLGEHYGVDVLAGAAVAFAAAWAMNPSSLRGMNIRRRA